MLSRYEVGERLGSGGMGVVYRAEDVTLHRPVALKFLSGTLLSQEQTRARFLREAQIAAALNHPNVCTIHEIGRVDPGEEQVLSSGQHLAAGTPFIAMEWIDGLSLGSLIATAEFPDLDRQLSIAIQIAEGLAAAHARGIVHRDLKPGNVMVTRDGRVKIVDFGLAKPVLAHAGSPDSATETLSDELTREGQILGTVAYMSPEQAMGKSLDARSDVFSFGTLLYEMVTGRRPFRGENPTSTLAKIIESEPDPAEAVNPELPPELARIIRRCLRKGPDDRYNDTRDLVVALRDLRVEATSGTRQRPGAGWEAGSSRRLSVTARSSIIAGVLVLVAALGIGAWWLSSRSSRRTSAPRVTHRQITFTGQVSEPEISPDGRSVVFVTKHENGDQDLVLQDFAGGEPLRLVGGPIFDRRTAVQPRWSPDGSEILFCGLTGEKLTVNYTIARLGGAPKPLPRTGFCGQAWSPDGRRIAGFVRDPHNVIRILDLGSGEKEEFALPADISWASYLAWSPRAEWFCFSTLDEQGQGTIWTVSTDGRVQNRVLEREAVDVIRWSATGDAIFFTEKGETTDLWKFRIDRESGHRVGNPTPILNGLNMGWGFSVSGNGRTLAYLRVEEHSNLWVAEKAPDGLRGESNQRKLTTGTMIRRDPGISPDGHTVAFSQGTAEKSSIFTMPMDGGPPRRISFLEGECRSPAWSPDGRQIAFLSDHGGAWHVWIGDASGGPPRVIETTKPSGTGWLRWAPGHEILYTIPSGRFETVRRLDPITAKEEPLTTNKSPFWIQLAVMSPDCSIVATGSTPEPPSFDWGLRLFPLQGGDPTRILGGIVAPVGWSADGSAVYAVDERTNVFRLLRVPVSGATPEELLVIPDLSTPRIDVSRDGSRVVYPRMEALSDVWLAENFDPDVR